MEHIKPMKKLWLAALLVLLFTTIFCLSAGAETYSGECGAEGDNVTWKLDTETGELVISGEGAMADYSSGSDVPWYTYRSSIKTVTIGDSVTSIGDRAFYYCSSLTSITIPEGVTSIGDWAFSGCSSLTSITVDQNNSVYHSAGNCLIETASKTLLAGCKNSVIPADGSVTSIGYSAFSGRHSLTSITIPDSVTSIGDSAFYSCSSLTSITIPEGVTSIGDRAFSVCSSLTSITIPEGVTSIGDRAFLSCTSLASITVDQNNSVYHSAGNCLIETASKTLLAGCKNSVIPTDGSVTSIGTHAFYNCNGLTNITIPDSVTSIGDTAFSYCDSLTSITIPDSVTSIGDAAFSYCDSLTSITIPDSVTSIGDRAFSGCSSLTSITIPDSVTSIGDYVFMGCSNLSSVTIPNSVTSIGWEAFSYCDSLTSITIPDSVTSIGDRAFLGCTSLKSVTIGDSVTSIGDIAFSGCSSLASITVDQNNSVYHSAGNCLIETASKTLLAGCKNSVIPTDGSVTSIGDSAFSGRHSLTSITIPESVTSIGDSAFYDCDSLTSITIPDSVTSIGYQAFSSCTSLTSVTVLSKTATIFDSSYTIYSGATIYGYAGSTAEAYATQYGRSFVALDETEELIDGSLVGFQVTKGENGAFSLRAIAGLNSLKYKNFGYEITITTKNEDGNDVITTLSGTDDKAYSSIYGGNTAYSIKETFGYEYAGLATITNLAVDSIYTKLEIRTFVTTFGGEVKYGKDATLLYKGETNEDGYPLLEKDHIAPAGTGCCDDFVCEDCGAYIENDHDVKNISNIVVDEIIFSDSVAVVKAFGAIYTYEFACTKACCANVVQSTQVTLYGGVTFTDVDGSNHVSLGDIATFEAEIDGVTYEIRAVRAEIGWDTTFAVQ